MQTDKGIYHKHFYPRPPRGGRQYRENKRLLEEIISIHALREEGDTSSSLLLSA